MTVPTQSIEEMRRLLYRSQQSWESLRQYNIKLENALCECVSLLTQHGIPVPPLANPVDRILQEKFIDAIKGE